MDFEKEKEMLLKMKASSSGGVSKDDFITIGPDQEIMVRILPGKDAETPFFHTVHQHYVRSGEEGNGRYYSCLRDKDQKCPLCEVYFSLFKTGDSDNVALARSIAPRQQTLMNTVERSSDTVKILRVGKQLFDVIMGTILDEEYGPVHDLDNGFDYKIKRVGKGLATSYTQSAPARHESPAGDQQAKDRYMGSLHDIQNITRYMDYDDVEKASANVLAESSEGVSVKNPVEKSDGANSVNLTSLLND
mgnify:CR=1 FL=1